MRRVATLSAAIALVGALVAPTTLVASSRPVEYLALGDSIVFGYTPLVSPYDTDAFVGYPDIVAEMLRDDLTNAACPGETSSHFVAIDGPDHGCGGWRFGLGAPLHADYATPQTTQLQFLDTFLKANPKTQLITLGIGVNDAGALRDACGLTADPISCIVNGLPGVLATISTNLDTIYRHIRVDDGYRHKIVALTFYSTNYTDPLVTGAVAQVNAVVVAQAKAWGAIVADGFRAFAAASAAYGGDTCAAGLRVVTGSSPLTCDDHPSAAGHLLLAQTIVNALRPD